MHKARAGVPSVEAVLPLPDGAWRAADRVTARPPRTAPVAARTVWLLTVAVVLAHVLVLRGVAMNLQTPDTLSTRVFSTRSIRIAPPQATPVALPRRPISLTPPPRAEPRPTRAVQPRTDGVLSSATPPPAAPVPPVEPAALVAPLPEPPDDEAIAQAALSEEAVSAPEPVPAASTTGAVDSSHTATAESLVSAVPASAELPSATAEATLAPAETPETTATDTTRPLTIPGSIRLAFDAVGKRGRLDYKAMGDLTWLQDGDSYDMRLEMGDWIIGKRVLSSTGKLSASGLAPTRFSDKFRSERAAHFDRQSGRIIFSANTPQAELMPGAQDQLSIFAQLAALVAGDPLAFPVGTTLAIQTAGPRDAETWIFNVEREELLYLPGGQVPALKLVRNPNKDYGQTVELWLAPELAFLPARIRITFKNGDFLDQQWKSSGPP